MIYLQFWLVLIDVFLLRKHWMVPLLFYLDSVFLILQLCRSHAVKLKIYYWAAMGALSALSKSWFMICTVTYSIFLDLRQLERNILCFILLHYILLFTIINIWPKALYIVVWLITKEKIVFRILTFFNKFYLFSVRLICIWRTLTIA